MLGVGQAYWADSIYVSPEHFSFVDTEFVHPLIKNLPVILSLLFMIGAYSCLSMFQTPLRVVWHNYRSLYLKWYVLAGWAFNAGFFNTVYNNIFSKMYFVSHTAICKYLDKGYFEYFGPFGVYKGIRVLHLMLSFSWYSIIFFSISFMFVGVTIFIWYWLAIAILIHTVLIKRLGLLIISIILFINYDKELN